jgi:hypothetical protein
MRQNAHGCGEKWDFPNEMPADVEGMVVGLMYYVQGFDRLGLPVLEAVKLEGHSSEQLAGKPYQKHDVKQALVNAGIRKAFYERSLTWRVEQTPGNFVPSIDCFSDWERKFINFLSGIPGVTGIPLHYVIREDSWHYNMGDHMEALAALASLTFQVNCPCCFSSHYWSRWLVVVQWGILSFRIILQTWMMLVDRMYCCTDSAIIGRHNKCLCLY